MNTEIHLADDDPSVQFRLEIVHDLSTPGKPLRGNANLLINGSVLCVKQMGDVGRNVGEVLRRMADSVDHLQQRWGHNYP